MKNNYFTLQEILSQPEVWSRVEQVIMEKEKDLKDLFSHKTQKVIFTGCGSSYYLALTANRAFNYFTGRYALALPASEIIFYPEIYLRENENLLLIPISRSGESTETVDALLKVKENSNAKVLGVSCFEESSLVRKSDVSLVITQAKEKSVVMTRSFTSMLLALLFTFSLIGESKKHYLELQKVSKLAEGIIQKYRPFCEQIIKECNCEKFVYLGSGPFYGLACEGALKMKEMANVSCETYHVLEYIHGPKSTADKKTMIFLLLPEKKNEYLNKFLQELTALEVQIFLECDKATSDIKGNKVKWIVEMNSDFSDFTRGLLYMLPLQLIAFYNTVKRGLNPDKPRNLTQVVRY